MNFAVDNLVSNCNQLDNNIRYSSKLKRLTHQIQTQIEKEDNNIKRHY